MTSRHLKTKKMLFHMLYQLQNLYQRYLEILWQSVNTNVAARRVQATKHVNTPDQNLQKTFEKLCINMHNSFLDLSTVFASRYDAELPFLMKNPEEKSLALVLKALFDHQDRFAHLEMLDLTNILLSDDLLHNLVRLGNLKGLGLSGTRITTAGLGILAYSAGFTGSLRYLKLCNLEHVDDQGN